MTSVEKNALGSARRRQLPWNDGQIQVLHALHYSGRASRRELAARSGLSPQSLTRISQELLTAGFIEELERRRTGGMGQPAIEMRIAPGRILSVGLVLEFDRVTCVLSDLAEGVVERVQAKGNFLSAESTVRAAEDLVAKILTSLPEQGALLGLGVSQSGFFFDPARQRIVSQWDVEGWKNVDLGARLTDRFDVDVFIENDGRAAATGHLVHGVGTKFSDFFVVLMTHGVGGGGVVNRRLIRGRSGNAGEMPRGWGMRASIGSLAEHLGVSHLDERFNDIITTALAEENPLMVEWLTVSAAKLESVLVGVCNVLDPEAIIFSGRMPESIRSAIASRISRPGRSIEAISAPAPAIVIDPAANCLEIGAAALPIARVFSEVRWPPAQA